MIAGNSRPAMDRAGAIILAWNVKTTVRVGVRAGGMTGVVTRNDGAITNEALRVDEEASCGATAGATD